MASSDSGPSIIVVNNSGTPGTIWDCTETVQVGDLVYQSDANKVDQADASSSDTMPGIGFVFEKPTSTTCLVSATGEISGFTDLEPALLYYGSTTPGKIQPHTDSPPPMIQMIGRAKNPTTLTIMIGEGLIIG